MSGGAGASSSAGGGGGGVGPEVWKGLLQWSMEHHDGTTDPSVGPMAEEKKQWLEHVMEGTFVDLAKRMRALLDKLDGALNDGDAPSSSKEEEEEEEAMWWEELQDHAEHLDFALLFCQVGGLKTLCDYLQLPLDGHEKREEEKNERRVLAALGVLAALTQNNPRVQAEVLSYCAQPEVQIDLLGLLCNGMLLGATGEGEAGHSEKAGRKRSPRLRAKALHALSCTVRSPTPTPLEARFVSDLALPVFQAALASSSSGSDGEEEEEEGGEEERVRAKALFFLQALLGADHADRARAEGLGLALLPLVARVLQQRDGCGAGTRHAAMAVVSEVANRMGGAAALLAAAGAEGADQLRGAMASRIAAIAALAPGSVEREEAEEEERFWGVLQAGGTFLRDGEGEGGGAQGQVEQGQEDEPEGQEEEAAAPPVLLLEGAPRLTGASQAP